MGTFSVSHVTAGQVITASVFNNLIDQVDNLNNIGSANFPATTAVVANTNLKNPYSLMVIELKAHSVAAGATMSSAGSQVQARNAVLYAGGAQLVGAMYTVASVQATCTVARSRLWVNNSTAIAASISHGSVGSPINATAQTVFTTSSFTSKDTIELKNTATGGAIKGINVSLYFKVPHKS